MSNQRSMPALALLLLRPSPIVALNRTIAVAEPDGPDRGLEEIRAATSSGMRLGQRLLYAR
jgi:predicted RNA polymerase sigma factor